MNITKEAIKILEGKNFASLATINSDGSPQVSVVWIDYKDNHILINTAKNRIKTNNMERDPRVSISVTDAQNPYYQITFKGIVKNISESNADDHIHSLAKKYLNQDKYPISDKEIRVIVSIEPLKFYIM
ncbi:MAG: PPOX class F420-dependent oxidoreductase [SAR202 cluster bacterium]|jgi:PPOX class probable F420-dependent enzyme|uniref:Pyridoxamine 5'-phosphate oxidase N-terminal domain-containing protein n=1 Tax=marine metagenome TaxID=408172 RepID=A0A381ZR58_9ZZZZ|nr:PPOX class F420-dependent oxidoreductase [SAR202 cluster bacterium]|tara:strand:- start:407 stop:793 length:387 start_codon:yes stop_codon:yes gene_type:complete